jgi:hypothetical protein
VRILDHNAIARIKQHPLDDGERLLCAPNDQNI